MNQAGGPVVGYPDEWALFYERHADADNYIRRIKAFSNAVFNDQPKAITVPDQVVFTLGCCAWEDAREILILAGNGLGNGAQKILRSLYEHAVTAAYLAKHPEDADAFQNYFYVQDNKLISHIFKFEEWAKTISPEQRSEAGVAYERHRAQFKQTPCPDCGRTPQTSWTKKNTEELAREAGEGWDVFYLPAFFYPTSHIHATAAGVMSRVVKRDGKMIFTGGRAHDEADSALKQAHILLLWVFRTQIEYFDMPHLRSELVGIAADLCRVWRLGPFSNDPSQDTTS